MTINYLENKKLKMRAAEALQVKLSNTDLSVNELTERSGVSRTTIWKIKKGHIMPNSATINKLEGVLEDG